MFQRLHSSITFEIWKRSAWQIRSCWAPLAALPTPLDPLSLRREPPGPLCSWPGLSPRCVLARTRFVWSGSPEALLRSEQLQQPAVQLASLPSLEDVVTYGLQSLLESPAGLIRLVSVAERALLVSLSQTQGCPQSAPRLRPAQPARLQRAVLLPRLSVLAPPAAPAPLHLLSALVSLLAPLASPAPPPCPPSAPRLLTPVRLPPSWPARDLLTALRRGAVAMSDGGAQGGTRNGPCGVRFICFRLPRNVGLL